MSTQLIVQTRRKMLVTIRGRQHVLYIGGRGPAGSPASYLHTQSSPASTWTINHNLGYRPGITVLDDGGAECDVEVIHTTLNQALVYHDFPATGTARLL